MATRIIHVTVRADYGGAPNYINTMVNNLSDEFEVFLACPEDEPYFQMWKQNPKVVDICYIPHRKFSITHFLGLLRFIKRHKINLVQANGKGAGVYGRLLKIMSPRIKVLFAYRGFHIFQYNSFQKFAYFMYERIMLAFTHKVINVSKGEREECIKHGVLRREKSVQIYNGITPLQKRLVPELENKYKDKFTIVTLSRFDIQKNMGLMYQIAYELRQNTKIQFIFIGDGEDKQSLEQKAKRESLRNIDFVGFKNHKEIAEYFSISDLYLTTSRWEGLPFALVEASSMGLPIVATDVIGNNEVCIDGENGILFPSENIEEPVQAILKLYNDSNLLSRYGNRSKEIFKEHFTVDKMVRNHEKLYLETLNVHH